MQTTAGASTEITYDPSDRAVRVKLIAGKNSPWGMISIADLMEIFDHLKTLFSWVTESQVYYQDPPRDVESFGLCPILIIIVPINVDEPTELPRY